MKKVLISSFFLLSVVFVSAKTLWTMTTECGVEVSVTMGDDPTVGQITAAWNAANANSCAGSHYHAHITINP